MIKEPGCEEEGKNLYTCACGDSYAEPIAAIVHQYSSSETKAPGCEELGQVTYFCHCGHSYTESIDPVVHNWGNWFVSVKPTFTTTGEEMRKCSICQKADVREIEKNGIEEELRRIATIAVPLPNFQSASELTAADMFNWVRIQAGWVSSDFNDTTFQFTNVYSLAAFDAVSQAYFGRTFDFVTFAEEHDEMTVDSASKQLIWVTYGAGGGYATALDSYTQIDDTHYTVRYYAYDYDNAPVYYGTLNVRLSANGFMIESHTSE